MLMTGNGEKPEQLASLIRYVRMQGGLRLYAVYFDDGTLMVAPKGQRDLNTVIMHSVSAEAWKKLLPDLEAEKVELYDFEGLSVAGDRLPGQAPPVT